MSQKTGKGGRGRGDCFGAGKEIWIHRGQIGGRGLPAYVIEMKKKGVQVKKKKS